MSTLPTLGYWNTRCYAQPIRFLLAYVGQDFIDKRYQVGPAPDFDKTCWFDVKYKLNLDFPNLPYYIDDKVALSQSLCILRHLGRKYGLDGQTEEEKWRVDLMEQESAEFRDAVVYLMYDKNFEKLKPQYLEELPKRLKQFSDFLGSRPWFAGETITFPDFTMYEFFIYHKVLQSNCLDSFQNLQEYVNRFENLENIKKYMKSPKFIAWPMNNPYYQCANADHPNPFI